MNRIDLLKKVAPYLPYNIECEILNYKHDYVGIKRSTVTGYYCIGDELYLTYKGGSVGKRLGKDIILLMHEFSAENLNNQVVVGTDIIHPISALHYKSYRMRGTKARVEPTIEISHNFISTKIYETGLGVNVWIGVMGVNKYWINRQLIEWHFDLFSLIEKGYAKSVLDA